jgi:UDP-3-O-[3-hydroxymyristoyl] N-acetylglucosamine deacetylase/3-hydroxyacyl-[acyl-carrier-protein] dehydratase
MGIDNAKIEVEGPEIPGLDGSAEEFCRKIEQSGIEEQDAAREYYAIEKPVCLDLAGASCVILPASELKVSYTLSYKNENLRDQFFETVIHEEVFRKEIAPARTFVLKEEVTQLMAKGYGRGADCRNTLVFEKNRPLDNTLRFGDEAARHKVLDLLGDLYLLGRRIKGHIITSRTGHAHNLKMVAALKDQIGGSAAGQSNEHLTARELDITMVKKILPHRYPFLFVDRVTILEEHKRAIGIKNVTVNDYFFQGHFPGHPVMPGVLIVEAMAQVGGVILLREPRNTGKLAYFMSIDGIKFRQPVLPGDQLKMDVTILRAKSKIAECEGKAYVDDKLVCEAILRFAIVDEF